MCRYCKKLNQIKDLEVKRLNKIISLWRRREQKCRGLLTSAGLILSLFSLSYKNDDLERLIDKIDDYLTECWIGK